MISLEVLPWNGKTLYLIDYVDLTFKEHPVDVSEVAIIARALGTMQKGHRKVCDNLEEVRRFIDIYLEHLGLYMAKHPPPEGGWIWNSVETLSVQTGEHAIKEN